MNQDLEQVKLLAIFHFIVAGIGALIACFPIIHLTVGLSMLVSGVFQAASSSGEFFPFTLIGLMFTLIAAAFIIFGWTFALCLGAAGYCLLNHRAYLYCLVMAGICCMFSPFGTVLGVFTIVVLMCPSVKELFTRGAVVARS